MITVERLCRELTLSPWQVSILMEEADLYLPAGVPRRVLPEGKTFSDLTGEEWRSLPLSDEMAKKCRERFIYWRDTV